MADEKPSKASPKPAATKVPDALIHPDPEGKMRSYAPGYGPGPDGEPVELPEGDKGVLGIGAVTSNPVHLPQRSE